MIDSGSVMVESVVDELTATVDALDGVDVESLTDSELDAELVALTRLSHRLEAHVARRAALWSKRGVWSSDGSRSATARLSRRGIMSKTSARRLIGLGESVVAMPRVAAAWAAGDIGRDHVTLLARAARGRGELFARDEHVLVDQASSLLFRHLEQAVEYWTQRADAELDRDGAPPPPDRYVHTRRLGDGTVMGEFCLDPIGGATVRASLRKIERELYRQDKRDGVVRSKQARLAAALVEMAERAHATPKGARRPVPLIMILAGESSIEHLVELSDGTVLRPGDVVPHMSRSMVQSFIFDGADRVVSASKQRTYRGTIRRAIQVRDRHCQHPSGCDAPIDDSDIDHIVPWAEGGVTDEAGGRLQCQPQNRKSDLHARAPADVLEDARWRRETEALIRERVEALIAQRPPPSAA